MVHTKIVTETVRLMLDRVKPLVAANAGHPTHDWLGKSFEMVAGKTSALAALAETSVVTDDPGVLLRAAARLGELVGVIAAEIPQRQAAFAILWRNGITQNWGLPEASEELRAVLRTMDVSKRLEAVTAAVQNPGDSAGQLLLGSTLPFGIHPMTTGLSEPQLAQLRESFIEKKLPAYVTSREDAEELFSVLGALLNFAGGVARDFSNPVALRQLENDREARLAANE